MDLVITFVSALLASSVAFFFFLTFHDLRPAALGRLGRRQGSAALGALAGGHRPLLPRTIRRTPLD